MNIIEHAVVVKVIACSNTKYGIVGRSTFVSKGTISNSMIIPEAT